MSDKADWKEKAAQKREQYYQNLADSVVTLLDDTSGKNWTMEWDPSKGLSMMPRNMFTGHHYQGGNMLGLLIKQMLAEHESGDCISQGQLKKLSKEHGEYVGPAKGQRGADILIPVEKKVAKKQEGLERAELPEEVKTEESEKEGQKKASQQERRVFFKIGKVFFLDQLTEKSQDIIRDKFELSQTEEQKQTQGQHIATRFAKAMGVEVEFGHAQAAYIPSKDKIVMPNMSAFNSLDEFASTLVHEIYHATGHESREGRLARHGQGRGLREKALEECRAELFSVFVGHFLGISEAAKQNNCKYIDSWAQKAKEDPREFVKATMGKVSPIMDAFMAFSQDKDPKLAWFPPKDQWPTDAFSLPDNDLPQTCSERKEDIDELLDEDMHDDDMDGLPDISGDELTDLLDDLDDMGLSDTGSTMSSPLFG